MPLMIPISTIRRTLPGSLAGLLAVACMAQAPAALAAKSPVRIEDAWTSPALAKQDIRSIAVLPAVTPDSYTPYHPLSDELAAVFMHDGRRWLTPLTSWQGLGNNEPERLKMFRQIASEVRDAGHTKKATTEKVASLLGVDALMFVRVDRWERVSDASDQTTVEAHTELVLADGTPMWKISGRSNYAIVATRPRSEMPKPASGNKLLEVTASPAPSGSGSSGGSSGGTPSAGSAGTGGSPSGSGSGGQASTPAPPVQKFEHEETSTEDLMRMSDAGQPDRSKDTFKRATEQLVQAWAARRPAAFLAEREAMKDAPKEKAAK